MSISEAVQAALAPKLCKFGRVLVDLPGPDMQAILDGLQDGLGATETARILTKNGHPLNEKAVRVHIAGDCGCKDAS